jgi:hypothetical protein
MEVVKGGTDRTGTDPAQRGGPRREVAGPEPLQPDVPDGVATGGREVGDGVDGFESDPEVAGSGPGRARVRTLSQRVT